MTLALSGDADAVVPGLLAEPVDPGVLRGRPGRGARAAGQLDVRQVAHDQDLLAVGHDLEPAGEPVLGHARREPGLKLVRHSDYNITSPPHHSGRGFLRLLLRPQELEGLDHDLSPVALLARGGVVP